MNFLFALLLPLFAQPQAAATNQPDAAAVMDGVQKFYQTTADFKAKFRQTYVYKVYGRTQVSSGKVFFKKPGRMRWDYDKPVPKLFVSDGQMLWVYEPQESQVFRRSLRSSQLPVALTFMSGKGRLEDEFTGKLLASTDDKNWLLELTPKKNAGDYQVLRLKVDRTTFQVQASTVVDPVGNTNTVEFSDIENNKGLPDKGFEFTPPAGVRIIEDAKASFNP